MEIQENKQFYIKSRSEFQMTKTDVFKGLTSKDNLEKLHSLRALIVMILNDPFQDHMIITVLNYVLPFQKGSPELKKALLLYWEVINKVQPDGKVLDEFLMVFNNIRNDLSSTNEHVVSLTLKLISKFGLKELVESIIPPLIEKCLLNLDLNVRRNAVECLYCLYEKFGPKILSNLSGKVEEILKLETDQTVKRDALILLGKVDRVKYFEFLRNLFQNEDLEDLSEICQLAIVQDVLSDDQEQFDQQNYQVALLFFNSSYQSVQLELAQRIGCQQNVSEITEKSFQNLLTILAESTDNVLKSQVLNIIVKMKENDSGIISRNFDSLVGLIWNESQKIKIFLIELIIRENINKRSKGILNILLKVLHEENSKKTDQFLNVILKVCQKAIEEDGNEESLNLIRNIVVYFVQQESLQEKCYLELELILVLLSDLSFHEQKLLKTQLKMNLFFIQDQRLLILVLQILKNLLVDNQECFQLLTQLKEINDKIEQQEEMIQNQDKLFYIKKFAQNQPEFSLFYLKFLLTLYSRLSIEEKQQMKPQLIITFLKLKKNFLTIKVQDNLIINQIQVLINQLNSDQIFENQKLKIVKKEQKPIEAKTTQQVTTANKVIQISQLNSNLKLRTKQNEVKTETKEIFPDLFQLTGFSDQIYSEAKIIFGKFTIEIELYIINQTDQIQKNINISYFSLTSEDGKKTQQIFKDKSKHPMLLPGQSAMVRKILSYDQQKEYQFFAEFTFQNNAGLIMDIIKTDSFEIPVQKFLTESLIQPQEFRKIWQDAEWELLIELKSKKSLQETFENLHKNLKLKQIQGMEITSETFSTYCLATEYSNQVILVNMAVTKEQTQSVHQIRV